MTSRSHLLSVLGILFFIQNDYTQLRTTLRNELRGTKTFLVLFIKDFNGPG